MFGGGLCGSGFLQLLRLHNWSLCVLYMCVCVELQVLKAQNSRKKKRLWCKRKHSNVVQMVENPVSHVWFSPEVHCICTTVWQSSPVFEWWITNVTHWSFTSYKLYAKIIKARYGLFLYTHPYLHMYIHLHVLFYKSDTYPPQDPNDNFSF